MKNKLLIINILILITFLMYKPINNKYIAYKDRVYSYNHTYNIKWIDNNNINGKRPQEITITIYDWVKNKLAEQTIQVTGDSSYTFENISSSDVIVTVNRVEDYKVLIDSENNIIFKYIPKDGNEYPTWFRNELRFSIEDENNNLLQGVELKIRSYYGEIIQDKVSSSDFYEVNSNVKYMDINKLLSKNQLDAIKNIKTINDLKNNLLYSTENEINNYGENIDLYEIGIPTLYILEETKMPNGYIKSKYFIPGIIRLNYQLVKTDLIDNNSSNYKIELESLILEPLNNYDYFDYNEYYESDYLGTDINKANELWKENAEKKGCPNIQDFFLQDNRRKEILENSEQQASSIKYGGTPNYGCPIILKADKGEISLSVDNKVNETKSLTTTTNTTLTYSVTLKNTGDIDAIDNVLTSKIPEGFKYVEGSASNNGEYKDGEIQWRVARVNTGEEKTYTFKVLVPKGTNITKDYIGESSVSNFAMQNRVNSDKTVVKLSLINPNTVTPITIIALVGISLIILIVLIINFYNNKKENKLYDNF